MKIALTFAASLLAATCLVHAQDETEPPYAVPVPGWNAPAPGEHPRLFFRKSDIPALRQRAQTPEGKAILERLRITLNGSDGNSLPTEFNPSKAGYEGESKFSFPVGAWTLWHMSGYGLLHVVTGDKKYADLSRQCVEMALAGQRDRDARYGLNPPSSQIRSGPSPVVGGQTISVMDGVITFGKMAALAEAHE